MGYHAQPAPRDALPSGYTPLPWGIKQGMCSAAPGSPLGVISREHAHPAESLQALLDEAQPKVQHEVLFEEHLNDLTGEGMRQELWKVWDSQEADMNEMRHDFAPGQHDYDDDYNPMQLNW